MGWPTIYIQALIIDTKAILVINFVIFPKDPKSRKSDFGRKNTMHMILSTFMHNPRQQDMVKCTLKHSQHFLRIG